VLTPDDVVGVVVVDAVDVVRRGGHRQDDLEDRRDVAFVEEVGGVVRARDRFQRFEQDLRLGHLHAGIGHAERDAQVLAQHVLAEVLGVVAQELLHHVGVDLLALHVPHLLVTAEV